MFIKMGDRKAFQESSQGPANVPVRTALTSIFPGIVATDSLDYCFHRVGETMQRGNAERYDRETKKKVL